MARPSLRRRLPRPAVAWFLVAAGSAGLAFISVRDLAARASMHDRGPTVPVVAIAQDVDAGSLLDPGDLELTQVPLPAPPGAVAEISNAAGALALTPFLAGEVVTATRLARPGSELTSRIPPGSLAVTLTVGAVPDGLARGDRVDVFATFTSARPYTTTVASDVTVLDVPTSSGTGFAATGGGQDVLVLTSEEVARQLVHAGATGALGIAVRGYEPISVADPAGG